MADNLRLTRLKVTLYKHTHKLAKCRKAYAQIVIVLVVYQDDIAIRFGYNIH